MAKKKRKSSKPHPWEDREPDLQLLRAFHGKPEADRPPEYDGVYASMLLIATATAIGICKKRGYPNANLAGKNAANKWMTFMQDKGGGFDRYDAKKPLHAYAYSHLKWAGIGRANRSGNPLEVELKAENEPEDYRLPSVNEGLNFEEREKIRRAVAALPKQQQQAVLWKYWGPENLALVARVLGINEDTLNGQLHRARIALRRLLGDVDPSL